MIDVYIGGGRAAEVTGGPTGGGLVSHPVSGKPVSLDALQAEIGEASAGCR